MTPDLKLSNKAKQLEKEKHLHVIEYVIDKIVSKASSIHHPELVEILISSDTLEICTKRLIRFCHGKVNMEVKPSAPPTKSHKTSY